MQLLIYAVDVCYLYFVGDVTPLSLRRREHFMLSTIQSIHARQVNDIIA